MRRCRLHRFLIITVMSCLGFLGTFARSRQGETSDGTMCRNHGRFNDCRVKNPTNVSPVLSVTGVCRRGKNIGSIHADYAETSNIVLSAAKWYISRSRGKRSEGAGYTLKSSPSGNLWYVDVEFMPRVPGGHTTVVVTSFGCVVREIPGL